MTVVAGQTVTKKNKGGIVFGTGGGAKDKTGAPRTPPLNMNHVPAENPQNDNEVEEMETQEGECVGFDGWAGG